MFQTDMDVCHEEVCSTAYLESSLPASTDTHHVCTILYYYVCLEVSFFPSLSFLLSCRLLKLAILSRLGLEGGLRVCVELVDQTRPEYYTLYRAIRT